MSALKVVFCVYFLYISLAFFLRALRLSTHTTSLCLKIEVSMGTHQHVIASARLLLGTQGEL